MSRHGKAYLLPPQTLLSWLPGSMGGMGACARAAGGGSGSEVSILGTWAAATTGHELDQDSACDEVSQGFAAQEPPSVVCPCFSYPPYRNAGSGAPHTNDSAFQTHEVSPPGRALRRIWTTSYTQERSPHTLVVRRCDHLPDPRGKKKGKRAAQGIATGPWAGGLGGLAGD
jgi:hypothetical protein